MINYLKLKIKILLGFKINELEADKIQLLKESYSFEVPKPLNIRDIEAFWFEKHTNFYNGKSNDVYYKIFRNKFLDDKGFVFSFNKIHSACYRWETLKNKCNESYLLDVFKNKKLVKIKQKVILIHDDASVLNYFHWLNDSLPKILFFKDKLTVVLPEKTLPAVKQSLAILCYETIILQEDCYYQFDEIHFVDNIIDSGCPNYYVPELKEKLISNLNIISTRSRKDRIYLSRKLASNRRVLGEEKLLNFLKSLDFKIIEAENLSFSEQMEFFYCSNVFITSHGAGLSNMMFMPKNSLIIELGRENFKRQPICFWHLAHVCKHQYNLLLLKDKMYKETTDRDDFINSIL